MTNCTKKKCLCVCSVFILLILMMIAAMLVCLIATSSYFLDQSLQPVSKERIGSHQSIGLLDNSLVSLHQQGFSQDKAIEVSGVVSKVPDNEIVFYKGDCDSTKYNQTFLKPVTRMLKPFEDNKLPMNYNYANLPVYSAGGNSTLIYNISVSSTDLIAADSANCPVQLYLFNLKDSYLQSLKPGNDITGFVNKSKCFNSTDVEINSTTTVYFPLNESNSYYVLVQIDKGINFETNISGHILEYTADNYALYKDCELNAKRNACTIEIHSDAATSWGGDDGQKLQGADGSDTICILAEANYHTTLNYSVLTTYQDSSSSSTSTIGSAVGVTLGAILLIIVLLSTIVVIRLVKKHNTTDTNDREPAGDIDDEEANITTPLSPENMGPTYESYNEVLKKQQHDHAPINNDNNNDY